MAKEQREEAIAVLKRTLAYDSEFADAKEVAIEALEYLEKNKKWIDLLNIFAESFDFDVNKIMWKAQEWIPCSERLPKECDGHVLVSKEDEQVTTGLHSEFSNVWYIGDMHGVGGCKVLAWMPLPEPYKVDNKNKQGLAYADQDTLMPAT